MITYIIGMLLFLTLCAIGARTFIKQRKHKKKQLAIASAYDRIIRESRLAIESSEFLCYRYIGLDKRNRKLLLIDHCNEERQEWCLPLSEIEESKIIYVKDELQGIKNILLELWNKRNNKPVQFCFFNKEYDSLIELPSLSRKAIHWKTRVDIHKNPRSRRLESEYVL